MRVLFRFLSALAGGLGLAFSVMLLAPARSHEATALGPEPPRDLLMQMRMARILRDAAPPAVIRALADQAGVPETVVRTNLAALAEGRMPAAIMPEETIPEAAAALGAAPAGQASSELRAGGARFVRPD